MKNLPGAHALMVSPSLTPGVACTRRLSGRPASCGPVTGESATVVRIADEDPELLRLLATLGLLPQVSVTVERAAASEATLLLSVDMARCALRREFAEEVLLYA